MCKNSNQPCTLQEEMAIWHEIGYDLANFHLLQEDDHDSRRDSKRQDKFRKRHEGEVS